VNYLLKKENLLPKKPKTKAPKIQRLVTPRTLQRKRHRNALKKRRLQKNKAAAAEYAKALAQARKEQRERKQSLSKKRASLRESQKKEQPPAPEKK